MTTFILGVLVAVLLNLLSDEIGAWMPWLAKRLIRRQAAKLPRSSERVMEQWLADLEERPGNVAKLTFALDLLRGRRAIVEAVPSEETPAPTVVPAVFSSAGSSSVLGISAPTIPSSTELFPPSVSLTGHAPSAVIREGVGSTGPAVPARVFVDSPSILSAGVVVVARADYQRRRHPAYNGSTIFETPLPLRVASSSGGN